MEKDEAIIRLQERTEGVAEAMHWLREDIDGVIYMLDATLDPFMQVNIMMVGIIGSRRVAGDHRRGIRSICPNCTGKNTERIPPAPGRCDLGA